MKIIKPGNFGENAPCDRMRPTYDAQNEQLIYKNQQIDILFIGDSITEMWDLNLYFGKYGFVVNRGICSDFTKYILKRAEADIFQLNPKALVHLAGINDIITCSPNLWYRTDGAQKAKVLSDAAENIAEIMKMCKERGVRGYFCSVLPTDFCVPYNSFGLEAVVLELNEKIKSACTESGMVYVDYYSRLCDVDGMHIKDGLTRDGVHPTAECYEIMAGILGEYLK